MDLMSLSCGDCSFKGQVLLLQQINFAEKQMQKFAIAIGLLLSLLFLTGSNVNAETAGLWHQIQLDYVPHAVDNAGGMPKSSGTYNPKAI